MGYQVLQSVIYKYNYPLHKNSGLKSNTNKINTQIHMKYSNWKAWNWWTFHNKSKVLFTVSFLSFSVLLSSLYIPANPLTYQRCWHIKINLLSLLIYLIKLNLMIFQVCYNFISFLILKIVIECPEETFKKLQSVTIYLFDNS